MNVSCLPVSFFGDLSRETMSLKQWAQMAADAGLDGIDLSVMLLKNHTPVYLKQIRQEIESTGMPVIMMATYPDCSHPDPLQRQRELEFLRHDIALSSYLGAKYLRIVAGQAHPEIPIAEGIQWVIDAFKQASLVAEKFAVQLVYENHSKPGAWEYADFSQPTEIFTAIAEGIQETGIGLNFDTANPQVYGDDPLSLLERCIDQIVTIHVADTAEAGKLVPVPSVIGEGLVPLPDIFRRLKQQHFDGWLCIEEASRTGAEGVRKAVQCVRQTWDAV